MNNNKNNNKLSIVLQSQMCIIVLALLAGKSLNLRRLTQKTQTTEHAQDETLLWRKWQRKQVQRPRTRNTENVAYENLVIPVVVGVLGTVKKGMVENIKKVSEAVTVTEIQKICIPGIVQILRKVLNVWTEWLTWVTDTLGAWFAPSWCTKRKPAKTVLEEIIIIIIIIR